MIKEQVKIFSIPAHNATVADDYTSLLIGFALLNLFHKPILSDSMHEDAANVMKSRVNIPNHLKTIVDDYNLSQVRAP